MISKNHIKYIQSLHSKKNRQEHSVFIIEGIKLVLEFLKTDVFEIQEVLGVDEFITKHEDLLLKQQVHFSVISEDELKKISTQNSPNQVLALVSMPNKLISKEPLANEIYLFLDDIRDPGNLGTIIRIADWFGISNVFCSKQSTEVYNPKTLQASMGAILRVNVTYIDFEDVLSKLPHLPIYGAILNGENIYRSQLKSGIIVIGNEANGISQSVLSKIKYPITIPSAHINGSESLNAANACAIICSEFHRQLNHK